MAASETIGANVEVLSLTLPGDITTDYIELRGNILVLNRTGTRWFTTGYFDTTGATVELKNLPAWYPHRLTLLFAAISFFLFSVANALTGSSYEWAILLGLAIVYGALLARLQLREGPVPVAILRLNTYSSVFELPVRYTPGANEILDRIVESFRPFEERYHRFESRESAHLATHWPDSESARLVVATLLTGLLGMISFLALVMMRSQAGHAERDELDLMLILVLLLMFAIGSIAAWRLYRRRLPKPFARQRESAHQAFSIGNYSIATDRLRSIDVECPHGDFARLALAHIAVVSGNHAAAKAYLDRISDRCQRDRRSMETGQKAVEHMETALSN